MVNKQFFDNFVQAWKNRQLRIMALLMGVTDAIVFWFLLQVGLPLWVLAVCVGELTVMNYLLGYARCLSDADNSNN